MGDIYGNLRGIGVAVDAIVVTPAQKEDEWEAYLNELRNENKRRPRCLEILDGLGGKRIIDRE